MDKNELKEIRKQKLPSVTAFSPRDSLSELSSPLGLPKEFTQMEQQLKEMHYCCILYEMLPTILMSSHLREEKDSRKLAAISVVAAGFGGNMDEELCNELLDDMDFHYNKVKCRKIEVMLPKLMKMVEVEIKR